MPVEEHGLFAYLLTFFLSIDLMDQPHQFPKVLVSSGTHRALHGYEGRELYLTKSSRGTGTPHKSIYIHLRFFLLLLIRLSPIGNS